MQAQQFNIAAFNPNTVYSDITTFLNDESFSPRTKTEYLHDIKLFFSFMSKPDLPYLTHEHLHIENSDVLRFRNFLIKDKKMKPTSVNRKIASLQSLYAYFRANKYETKYSIDTNVFKVKRLKGKSNSYGYLSMEEVDIMIQLVKKQVKGYEKSCLIKLATRTSLREETLLNLTWNDIVKDSESDYYLVKAFEEKNDKEMIQPITKQLYDELLRIKELKYYERYSDDKIFHISTNTICAMMKTLCEEMGLHTSRRIVFHSMRNFAPNYILDTQNDLKAAQLQTGHTNVNTLWSSYVNKSRDFSQMAGVILDETVDNEAFDKLTFEELKQLVNDTKNGLRSQLLREATKIINQRETANP